MRELDNLIPQVLKNCDISDSRHAGLFSVCGLALRLRDLYKWEKGLDPWLEKDSSAILDWIGEKEQIWEQIAENDYRVLQPFRIKDPNDNYSQVAFDALGMVVGTAAWGEDKNGNPAGDSLDKFNPDLAYLFNILYANFQTKKY